MKKSRHPLCLQYLDESPLERMHVAEAYILCSNNSDVDIFQNMSTKDYDNIRHVVVKLVLATDLAAHFGFIEKLKLTTRDHNVLSGIGHGNRNPGYSTSADYVEIQLAQGLMSVQARNVDNITAMKIAIKLSDIGHCAKELQLHLKWSELVNEEFYRQGDLERQDRLHFPNGPQPLWDREASHLMPKNQANFIRIFITPFHEIVSDLFPTMKYVKGVAARNFEYWSLYADSSSAADDKDANVTSTDQLTHSQKDRSKRREEKREQMVVESSRKLKHDERGEVDESVARDWSHHRRDPSNGEGIIRDSTGLVVNRRAQKKMTNAKHMRNATTNQVSSDDRGTEQTTRTGAGSASKITYTANNTLSGTRPIGRRNKARRASSAHTLKYLKSKSIESFKRNGRSNNEI